MTLLANDSGVGNRYPQITDLSPEETLSPGRGCVYFHPNGSARVVRRYEHLDELGCGVLYTVMLIIMRPPPGSYTLFHAIGGTKEMRGSASSGQDYLLSS